MRPGERSPSPSARSRREPSAGPPAGVQAGPTVPGFEVRAVLGHGARTTVYRVTGPDGLPYALKVLDDQPEDDAAAAVAFRREAALVAAVGHPALPRVHEVGAVDGRPYLVMDLVDGSRLSQVLQAGPLSPDGAVTLALELVGALGALHRQGLVHRDVKPQNIMITPDGEARLIDFGLAVRHGLGAHAGNEEQAVGTLAYAAPEQTGMLRRPVDGRADLYALGVVLFECLSGHLPFAADDIGELLRMHAVVPAPDLNGLVTDLSPELAGLVATLLAKDPDDRYASSRDLAVALRSLRPDVSTSTPEVLPVPHVGAGAPLTGRERELASLSEAWRVAQGGHGSVVALRGPGGIGKTRLAQELLDQVGQSGRAVLTARCSDDDTRPLAPLRRALEHFVLALDLNVLVEQRQRQVTQAAGPAAAALAALSPALAAVLHQPPGAAGAQSQDQLANVVAGFLADLAATAGGLVLHLDDVHWLDPVSRRVLSRLAAELDRIPVLVLLTSRDDPTAVAATEGLLEALGEGRLTQLTVGPLDGAGLAALLAAALPGVTLDDRARALLVSRGEGNPFLALQYVHAVLDAGLLVPHWGGWRLDEPGLAELDLPQDVLGLVLARIQDLGPDCRGPLVTAAALGTRFRPGTVAAVSGQPLAAILDVLTEAAGRGLVEPVDGGGYAFVHDRIREALAEPDPAAAALLHHDIAEALAAEAVAAEALATDVPATGSGDGSGQCEANAAGDATAGPGTGHLLALARHTLLSGDHADPAQVRARCEAAGRAALLEHDPASAVMLLRAADRALPTPTASVLLPLGVALARDGRLEQACAELSRVLDLTDDPLQRAEALAALANCERSRWHSAAAAEAVDAGLAALGAALPAKPLARLLSAGVLFVRGNRRLRRAGRNGARPVTSRTTGAAARRGRSTEAVPDTARLARLQLLVELHSIAAYLGLTAMAPARMLLHVVHARSWADRLGAGVAYVRAHALFGFCFGGGGLHGLARRSFAEAAAASAGQPPAVVAEREHFRAAMAYFSGADDGQLWKDMIRRYGRWMEPWTLSDGLATMVIDDLMLGRGDLVAEWEDVARRRLGEEAVETTWFTVGPPMLAVLREQEPTGGPGGDLAALTPGHAAMHALVRAFAAWEAGPATDGLTAAVAQFDALGLKPAMLVRGTRYTLAVHAMARLDRCRIVPDADRAAELALARVAVRRLARVASTSTMRWYLAVARADLDVLDGRPRRALRRLDRAELLPVPDAPRLAFETARVRARAFAALDRPASARRQVSVARTIAGEQGWSRRCTWLDEEFGEDDDRAGRTSGSVTTGARTRSVGSLGASGLDSARAQTDRRRLQAVEQVGAAASKVLDPRALARIALGELTRILAADRALLFLTDNGDDRDEESGPGGTGAGIDGGVSPLRPYVGRDASGAELEEFSDYSASLVERVRSSREPLVVTGTEEGAALGSESVVLHGLRSILVAPLLLDHRLLGVVYLDSRVAKGIFTADDLSILSAVTAYVAASLETARAAELELSVQAARHQRDLAEHARELERQQAQASRLESIGRLAAGIAHEINTPLQFVTDNTRFLVDATSALIEQVRDGETGADADGEAGFLAEEIPDALRESLDGLARVTEIVRAMKDYAHPGTERADTDLNQALRTTTQVCRNEWKHVAELELDLDPRAGTVSCYEGELKQVLLNMIVNAAQAVAEAKRRGPGTRPGAGPGRIVISSRRTDREFVITITDDGIGMDEHVRRHAFDPFFTTKEVGQGTGQGLALAHAVVVSKHHGRLEVDSTPGRGATFTIALPLRPGREDQPRQL